MEPHPTGALTVASIRWLAHGAGVGVLSAVLALAACSKPVPETPAPVVDTPVPDAAGATARPVENPGVPPAATVFPPGGPVPAETDGTRKPAQAPAPVLKPMPGQNNDHSAPLSSDP